MRPRHAVLVSTVLGSLAATALADFHITSAHRQVHAGGGRTGDAGYTEDQSTEQLGQWYASALSPGYAGANQQSDISEEGVTFFGSGGSGGGAGHWAFASYQLTMDFRVDTAMVWSLTRTFAYYPMGMPVLIRLSDNTNLFAGLSQYLTPLDESGFMDAGAYRLIIQAQMFNGPNWHEGTVGFSVTAPAPGGASVLLMSCAVVRRRHNRPVGRTAMT